MRKQPFTKFLLKKYKVTQSELANLLGWSRQRAHQYYHGEANLRLNQMRQIREALNIGRFKFWADVQEHYDSFPKVRKVNTNVKKKSDKNNKGKS